MPFFLITLITGATAAIAIAAVVDWFDKPADNLPDKMPDGMDPVSAARRVC